MYRTVYKGEENASFASTLHNLGMAFRAMAEDSKKLEKIPLMERAAESFERCVQIREKVMKIVRYVTARWISVLKPLVTHTSFVCVRVKP